MARYRRAAMLVSSVGLAIGSLVVGVSAAGAAGTTLTAKPNTKLVNDQVVKVKGQGFTPNDHVFLIECLATATGESGCDLSTATAVTIAANGKLPATSFMVVTGKIGTGKCGTTKGNIKKCVINAGNVSGGDTGTAPITFAVPSS